MNVFYLYTCGVFQAPTFNESDFHCKWNRQQQQYFWWVYRSFGMLATNFFYHLCKKTAQFIETVYKDDIVIRDINIYACFIFLF